jgi:hypothetical protein
MGIRAVLFEYDDDMVRARQVARDRDAVRSMHAGTA